MAKPGERKVSTDALETLGTIIGPNEKRDAIHIAVLPVVAGARLYPGQSIDAVDGIASAATEGAGLGIVDPFLTGAVFPEQRFWMLLRPRLVTSLRHVWSHPAFRDEEGTHAAGGTDGKAIADKAAARAALERIADQCDSDVEQMIEGANQYLDRGDYLCEGGRWEGTSVPDEFWPLFETYTGRQVPSGDRGSFFTCSC